VIVRPYHDHDTSCIAFPSFHMLNKVKFPVHFTPYQPKACTTNDASRLAARKTDSGPLLPRHHFRTPWNLPAYKRPEMPLFLQHRSYKSSVHSSLVDDYFIRRALPEHTLCLRCAVFSPHIWPLGADDDILCSRSISISNLQHFLIH